jgi:hypothetical protein
MEGDDALVIAAGPSLHKRDTAKVIKDGLRAGWKGTLIATESSISWCLRQGITPDLAVTLDPHPTRITRWFGDPNLTEESLKQDDYFARQDQDPNFGKNQIRFNDELVALINEHGRKVKIAVSSSSSPAVVRRASESGMEVFWWNPMYDDYDRPDGLTRKVHAMNGLPCVNAGGNVGSACWVFAHAVLQKKRVGLVGLDFGYYADTAYENTQYYKELCALVGEDRLDEVYVKFTNPHMGVPFYTDPAYLWYRNSFLEMATESACETHNCTDGGILFGEGIRWTSLHDFLAGPRS